MFPYSLNINKVLFFKLLLKITQIQVMNFRSPSNLINVIFIRQLRDCVINQIDISTIIVFLTN